MQSDEARGIGAPSAGETPAILLIHETLDVWDPEKIEIMRNISLSRISSRKGSMRESRESLEAKYGEMSREELLMLAVSSELQVIELEDENFALIEQINQCQRDILTLQTDFENLKKTHNNRVVDLKHSKEKYRELAARRESDIIFLEEHAKFSAEQTRLAISHWDMLLKNRDENIDLLSRRIAALTASSSIDENVSMDKFRCLQERLKVLSAECKSLRQQHSSLSESGGGDEENLAECPWRHQAEVRVAQLERVTGQLNATYAQLHSKSDELLIQNRELGSLRRKVFDCEAKVKKYRMKSSMLRERIAKPVASNPSTETSSIQSSE
jgi:hypothetical protein